LTQENKKINDIKDINKKPKYAIEEKTSSVKKKTEGKNQTIEINQMKTDEKTNQIKKKIDGKNPITENKQSQKNKEIDGKNPITENKQSQKNKEIDRKNPITENKQIQKNKEIKSIKSTLEVEPVHQEINNLKNGKKFVSKSQDKIKPKDEKEKPKQTDKKLVKEESLPTESKGNKIFIFIKKINFR